MRLRLGTGLAAVAAALAAGCGGGGEGPSALTGQPIGFQELASSATSSADARSGRFSFVMTMAIPTAGEPFTFAGEGAFDTDSKRASFSVDMSSFAALLGGLLAGLSASDAKGAPDLDDPGLWKIEAVQDGSVSYVRFPALDHRLPSGKTWIRADGNSLSVHGMDFSQLEDFTTNDPRALLELLRSVSGEVEQVGIEQLRGVETVHYRAAIDPGEAARLAPAERSDEMETLASQLAAQAGLSTIPVDVWLDAAGLVRKLVIAFSAREPGATQSAEVSITFELWDYGESVAIDLPPASAVVDASTLRE